jgi:uncharacterized protein
MSKCPICDRPSPPRKDNPSFPFCGARCKMVDLGKWVNEEYRIPVEADDGGNEGEETADDEHDAGAAASKTDPFGKRHVRH